MAASVVTFVVWFCDKVLVVGDNTESSHGELGGSSNADETESANKKHIAMRRSASFTMREPLRIAETALHWQLEWKPPDRFQ